MGRMGAITVGELFALPTAAKDTLVAQVLDIVGINNFRVVLLDVQIDLASTKGALGLRAGVGEVSCISDGQGGADPRHNHGINWGSTNK